MAVTRVCYRVPEALRPDAFVNFGRTFGRRAIEQITLRNFLLRRWTKSAAVEVYFRLEGWR